MDHARRLISVHKFDRLRAVVEREDKIGLGGLNLAQQRCHFARLGLNVGDPRLGNDTARALDAQLSGVQGIIAALVKRGSDECLAPKLVDGVSGGCPVRPP